MVDEIKVYKDALQKAITKINELDAKVKEYSKEEDIAVIGYECRFPGGANCSEEFWKLLCDGYDATTKIPKERFDVDKFYSESKGEPGKMSTQYASLLDTDIRSFDYTHFEMLPKEATSLDPQHKLLMEVSWEALEDAGLDIDSLKGSNTGVFIGMDSLEYVKSEFFSGDVKDITPYSLTGISQHSAAGRMAYYYDFHGPAVMCNTACSSSLVALNAAVESLKNHQCDMAIVGGVNILLTPMSFIALSQIQSLSNDGRCKTFSKEADGFGRGEGCGVVVLKRVEDAKKDRNTISAIIKSTFVGQDGKCNGFFAPNGLAEQRVIKEAIKKAQLSPKDIDYIEAHGTGTVLGDFIETQAVGEIFKEKKEKLYMGAVKSNIGHLEAASGMASLIKVILSLKYKMLPPSIHCENLNPELDTSKLEIVRNLTKWNRESGKRRAGINAFGISGTLAHVIVEEPDEEVIEDKPEIDAALLTLAARTKDSLRIMVNDMQQYLQKNDANVKDICYTTNIVRSKEKYRFSCMCSDMESLKLRLEEALSQEAVFANLTGVKEKKKKKVAYLFTGQGSIYLNIAKKLYEKSAVYAKNFDLCNELFEKELGISLKDALFGEDERKLDDPVYSQSAIFTVQYALTQYWDSLGIKPDVVMGHSIGEYAAACYAGVFSLEDAVKIVAARGSIVGSGFGNGKMVGVLTDYETVKASIERSGVKNAYIAAVNAPKNVTLSGTREDVDAVIKELQRVNRVFINDLGLFYPYHTDLLKEYEKDYEKAIESVKFSKPRITVISSKTGTKADINTLGNATYWAEHLTNPVNFKGAVNQAFNEKVDVFIEIGGTGTLSGLVAQNNSEDSFLAVPSLRKGVNEYAQLLESLGKLYNHGIDIDWQCFWEDYAKKKVQITNYGFARKTAFKELFSKEELGCGNSPVEEIITMEQNTESVVKSKKKDIEQVREQIRNIMHSLTSLDFADIEFDKVLFSFGFDSLMLVNLGKQLNQQFRMDIPLDAFFTELNTLEKIAGFIFENCEEIVEYEEPETDQTTGVEKTGSVVQNHPAAQNYSAANMPFVTMQSIPANVSNDSMCSIQELFREQLRLISEQNSILMAMSGMGNNGMPVDMGNMVVPEVPKQNVPKKESKKNYYIPYKKLQLKEAEELEDVQHQYVNEVKDRYNQLTNTSKKSIQEYRDVYANARNIAGFRPLYKEMIYQIVVKEGHGSKIIDLDDNEYVDITMGFGVNFFGHAPKFVTDALENEIKNGLPLGPMGRLPGEVARKISELTGVERVFFCNSGTEADMVAVRLARAITGRNKIVAFSGAYHGTYDGVLGVAEGFGNDVTTKPVAPGITENAVKDLILLNYNTEESLRYIEENHEQIAGVLVETVQSRRPDVQPKEYLVKLREITKKYGIALIFDEVITGFRIGAGGAQEYFGIEADIVTYGKVLGGGMPIGVVAGKAMFMDSVDGGMWKFGDDSVPPCNDRRTMVAGTFCHHPMAMAAANAVLDYIIANKDSLYTTMNQKMKNFIDRINHVFDEEQVPFKAVNFGSLFRFYNILGDYDIFYYGLVEKGIYIWEGRNCFISTEHTQEDLDKIVNAVREVILEMKAAGYFNQEEKGTLSQVSKFPMSLIQERLYTQILISEADPFDMVSAYILKEKPDMELLERVIKTIIGRHESLRTKLTMENGEFMQEVASEFEFHIEEMETNATDMKEVIMTSIHPFNLAESKKAEVLLVTTGDKKQVLIFHFHHTTADGISMNNFVQEMVALYQNKELPQCTQYRDFVKWEKDYLGSSRLQDDEKYWLENIDMDTYHVPLPYDYRTTQAVTYEGNTLIGYIKKEELAALNKIAKDGGASTFMILVAAVNLLMHRVSNQKDVAVVTPVSNRFHGGFGDAVGMFTNMIVLKGSFAEKMSFKGFLEQEKMNCLQSYLHLDYPYNLLVKNLKEKSEHLFNINFVYEKTDDRVFDSSMIDMEEVEYIPATQEFEVTFELLEQGGEVKVCLRYQTELFREDSMQVLLDRFLHLVRQIIADPDMPVDDIDIVTQEEKNLIFNTFNSQTYEEIPCDTILPMFLEQVKLKKDEVAVRFRDEELTYQEFYQKASSLADVLREKGVKPNDFVAIVAERSLEMVLSIYAVVMAGAAYVPIDPEYPEQRIQYILNDSKPKVVLKQIERALDTEIPVIDLSDKTLFEKDDVVIESRNKPTDMIYCIYTSGTTGVPKGVAIQNKNLANYITYGKKHYLEEKVSMPLFTNYCFDLTVTTMFLSLCSGGTLDIMEPEAEPDIADFISNDNYTFIKMTPAHLRMALQCGKVKKSPVVKHLILGGEALDTATTSEIMKQFGDNLRIHNEYGPTETTIGVCDYIYKVEDEQTNVLIGKPLTNTQIYIMNDNKLCGINNIGELCIAGAQVAEGYLNQEELTKEKFIENPFGEGKLYRSGDCARWLPDGELECLGRFDDQVKLRGFRIELGEIENVIRKIDYIKDVCVIIQKDKDGEDSLCAYLVSDREISFQDIREKAGKHLPDYMMPSRFMQMDKIPLTRNGKVDRRALPFIELQSEQEYEAPVTEEEIALCAVFEEVLGIKRIGVYDKFFELGGDSIKAIRIVSKMRERGFELLVKDIMKYHVVRKISAHVVKKEQENYEQDAVSGEVLETPMLRIFREMKLNKPEHYNQATMIRLDDANEDIIKRTLDALVEHHDVLRSVYRDGTLVIRKPDEGLAYDFSVFEVNEILDKAKKEMEAICTKLQGSIQLQEGPLVKAALIKTKDENLLMLCLHHLIVDGVSWRIITEDFHTQYDHFMKNEDVAFPEKTASFIQWSQELDAYSKSSKLSNEAEYWDEVWEKITSLSLPDIEDNLEPGVENTGISLEKDKTEELLKNTNQAFNTQVNDILLCALIRAVHKLTGQEQVTVGLEGHGREELHKKVNIDRTVGWFTTLYPVNLTWHDDLKENIVATKETLRQIPNHGIGYGLFGDRYSLDPINLYFNYMGQLDEGVGDSLSSLTGVSVAPENGMLGSININGIVNEGKLQFMFEYMHDQCKDSTIEQFSDYFKEELESIVSYCMMQKKETKTLSDYGAKKLTASEFDEIMGMFD